MFIYLFIQSFILTTSRAAESGTCDKPLLAKSIITATSQASDARAPTEASLNGDSAWVAKDKNYQQYLDITFPTRKVIITSIATQGLETTGQYVSKFTIQYSEDGDSFRTYKTPLGFDQVFKGNSNGDSVQKNFFKRRIITQWLRINPKQWHDGIAMRIELYGCNYTGAGMSFDGASLIRWDLTNRTVHSYRDYMRFRFRTNYADGIIIYSSNTEGDVFALQMVTGQLLLSIDLGNQLLTSIAAGNMLDDNLWHDVLITRYRENVTIWLDHVVVKGRIRGNFHRLDLDRQIFIGGILNFNQEGLLVKENFTGCIENLLFNHSNVIAEMLIFRSRRNYKMIGRYRSCEDTTEQLMPISFKTEDTFLKVKGFYVERIMNISLEFRTFYKNGLLIFHKFQQGYLQIFLKDGKLQVSSQDENRFGLNIFRNEILNDGKWHSVKFTSISQTVELIVDEESTFTPEVLHFLTGTQYFIAGGIETVPGFVGCIRNLHIADEDINFLKMAGDNHENLTIGSCQVVDKCHPNPCEHGGICEQTWLTFSCNCEHTGYGGAVCHTSIFPLSCDDYHEANPHRLIPAKINIDIDGSGPLKPFAVTCDFSDKLHIKTLLSHKNAAKTIVPLGLAQSEIFVQDITYDTQLSQVIELLKRKRMCRQKIEFESFDIYLNNTDKVRDEPLFWWKSHKDQDTNFWNGTTLESRKCYCRKEKYQYPQLCNCDLHAQKWEGVVEDKMYLPVRQLRFGTAISPEASKAHYTLGDLVCEGDSLLQRGVTFTSRSALIPLSRLDFGSSSDIYFQFKTTAENGVILHSTGPTDYIKITIHDGKTINFSWLASNSKPKSLNVTAKSLNDNKWHSVTIERNLKEVRLLLDHSLEEVARETDGYFQAIYLTSDLTIGATIYGDEGYLGCIRAFSINGEAIHYPKLHGLDGITTGCHGKCSANPCLNNATCVESYEDFSCDCKRTAFRGLLCSDEVGVDLQPSYRIQYTFEKFPKPSLVEKIHLGFRTIDGRGMLLGLQSEYDEYFIIAMTTNGLLHISFNFGYGRQDFYPSREQLTDDEMHDVRISRSSDLTQYNIKIDEAEEKIFDIIGGKEAKLDGLKFIFIGRDKLINDDKGFEGCISRVEFYDIFPLKLLFQQPKLHNVVAEPDDVSQDYCGIDPITRPPVTVPTESDAPTEESDSTNIAILGGVLALLFIILVIIIILCIRYATTHKGEYDTHEDEGTQETSDADTAVLQAYTVPVVSKKREWFM